MLITVGRGGWGLGTQLLSGREQSKSRDLSEWATEQTRDNDLNCKANDLRFTRFEEGRPFR